MAGLPDPDLPLRDCAEHILDSSLGRKALQCDSAPGLAVFLRDLVAAMHRLTHSCHLPEFTDHGLFHVCSIVDRMSIWSCAPSNGRVTGLVDCIDPAEAAVLLAAALTHDIGMLSQRPEDLPPDASAWEAKGQTDVPAWVRQTHVDRIEGLLKRVVGQTDCGQLLENPLLFRAIAVAKAHQSWPWEPGFADLGDRDRGLAAVLAVSDLLDENASRCDTSTLLRHRQGTMLNFGHWIRHGLTAGRVLVDEGVVNVTLVRPPGTDNQLLPVYQALRNHFRLTGLYATSLSILGGVTLNMSFAPETGCPVAENPSLSGWSDIRGLPTQDVMAFHVLCSFLPLALQDSTRVTNDNLQRVCELGLESIDLSCFHRAWGAVENRSSWEMAVAAIDAGAI